MRIIGIAGKSGSGKNTVAAVLAAELIDHGHTVKLDAFSVPIKDLVRRETAMRLVDKTASRNRMQEIGSVMRRSDPNYYLNSLIGRNNLDAHLWENFADAWKPADFLILSDLRFPSEAEFCGRHGVVWLVERARVLLSGPVAAHESEHALTMLDEHVDYVIINDGSLGDLTGNIQRLVRDGRHLKRERGVSDESSIEKQ